MLEEWIKSLQRYIIKSFGIIAKDVNGKPFSRKSRVCYHLMFLILTGGVVFCLPRGLSGEFIDYIKDVFAIFVGFFVTVLCFVFDKLGVERILTQEELDDMPADKRGNYMNSLRIKQEHNYTIRFFYTLGLIILESTAVIFLLLPNIFWADFFNLNVKEYVLIDSIKNLSWCSVLLFGHLLLCVIYRMVIIYLTIKVFYYTVYSVSSLLQVLIKKKNLELWN